MDMGSSPSTENTCLAPKTGVFTGQFVTTAGVLTGHVVTTAGVLTGHFVNILKIRSYMYIYMISKQTHVSNRMDI
jgi:hypothetical protein